jgi:hypothetical protein
MHDNFEVASDYDDYERVKDSEGGLHTGREAPHKAKTMWLLLFGIVGLLAAFYLVSRIAP